MSERTELTVEEAATRFCPFRANLPNQQCVGPSCMGWVWGWQTRDGFEEDERSGIDWRDFDDDDLRAYLTQLCGAEDAEELMHAIDNDGEYDAEAAIDAALDDALQEGLDEWAANNAPEGDGWGLVDARVEGGVRYAVYKRSAKKRGSCGMTR